MYVLSNPPSPWNNRRSSLPLFWLCERQSEGTEEAADAEVDRVIVELTQQTLLPAGEAPSARVPTAQQLDLPAAPEEEKTAVDEDFQRMQARLHAL